jgi:uncharacterized protein YbjT (DUF2867 family)
MAMLSTRILSLLAWATLLIAKTDSLAPEQRWSSRCTAATSSSLFGGRRYDEHNSHHGDEGGPARQRLPERPTQTSFETIGPPSMPPKPKIVILGASGKIGRLVVRNLLERNIDATIVAVVRNYDKACSVLYDDLLASKSNKRGAKLEIVEGDLVPPEELPGYLDDEEGEWMDRAKSAAAFYGSKATDYDNRNTDPLVDSNEVLEEAIKGCTTIISCVGSVRPTHIVTDLLARPLLRLLRKDVSHWCKDPRHPYYVHYASTRKALGYAEREQLRQEAATAVDDDDNQEKDANKKPVPRIRFIRISDLCVAQKPWHFVPIVTNAMYSMVFRYQDMAERLLCASRLVETVILRPGDLVDEERDIKTTTLQVDPSGVVPSPARIGREDVADLAVAAAMFDSQRTEMDDEMEAPTTDQPFHYTLAARWTGHHMEPYPPQGHMKHGMPNANLCMQAALQTLREDEKKARHRRPQRPQLYPEAVNRFAQTMSIRRNVKPYGICVAIPVYFFLAMMTKRLLQAILLYIPRRGWMMPATIKAGELLAMAGGFLLGHLSLIMPRFPAWIPARAAQKYISF